jgi:CRP-like cAMP-binding protein
MEAVDFLSKVSIFSLVKEADLLRIAELTRRRLYQEGEVIIKEGNTDGRLFIIVTGQVEVIKDLGEKNERLLRSLGPQSYFGEMALIDNLVRSASVVAKEETQVLSLEKWNLREEIEKYPVIALELLQMLSRRIRAIEKGMVRMLGAFLPICSNCKKIRDEENRWRPIEEYIADHSETEFSHSICPECAKSLYPQFYEDD